MPVVLYVIKKILAFFLCFVVSSIIAEVVVIGTLSILGFDVLHGEMPGAQIMTLFQLYGFVIFSVVILLYCKLVENRTPIMLGFNRKVGDYFVGILIAVILLALSIVVITMFGAIRYYGIFQNINSSMIFLFMGAFIIQGATEELLCRGFLMGSLQKRVSNTMAIFINSAIFALLHFSALFDGGLIYGIIGTVNLIFVSVIFSVLTFKRKNIWIACGMHSFWNFILFNILGLNLSGNEETSAAVFNMQSTGMSILNGGTYGIEASILTALILGVFAIWLFVKVIVSGGTISQKG